MAKVDILTLLFCCRLIAVRGLADRCEGLGARSVLSLSIKVKGFGNRLAWTLLIQVRGWVAQAKLTK